ncbi:uncharacterized protein VTP21DRAFT_9339 [Calcarisporiella thermophila]|uniref:uncharacterized protein n=1 Tax=Calcarisporiella thermophila TaxID=911321 RepID=UPI003742A8AE
MSSSIFDGRNPAEAWQALQAKLEEQTDQSLDNNDSDLSLSSASTLDIKTMKTFGVKPLDEDVMVVRCKECSKPVLPSNFAQHLKNCRKSNGDLNQVTSSTINQSDSLADVPATPSHTLKLTKPRKKRKASIASNSSDVSETVMVAGKRPPQDDPKPEKSEKKRKEKAPKEKKSTRVKGEIDLDRQCGVQMGPNQQCTRSLTCKNHSMASKRGVVGRSQPYDVLLAAYQKKSTNRFAGVPPGTSKSSALAAGQQAATHAPSQVEREDVSLDSDEEVNAVLEAVRYHRPQPLLSRPVLLVNRRARTLRVRDTLLEAIAPANTSPSNQSVSSNPSIQQISRQNFAGLNIPAMGEIAETPPHHDSGGGSGGNSGDVMDAAGTNGHCRPAILNGLVLPKAGGQSGFLESSVDGFGMA